jgi:MFS transporter, FHS family, L-fucose permease
MTQQGKSNYLFPLIVMFILFFLFGFITTMSNSLITFLKDAFHLTYAKAQIVNSAFYGAYIMSIPIGFLLNKTGYKRGIVLGLALITIGFMLFYPAVDLGYAAFLSALFIVAIGVAILQVAANPYILALGDPGTASSRLTLVQGVNSLATFFAPIFVSGVILATTTTDASAVKGPFLVFATITLILGIIMYFLKLPEITSEVSADDKAIAANKSVWSYKHLILGTVAIGIYMGIEITIPSFLPKYIQTINPDFLESIKGNAVVNFLAPQDPSVFMIALYWLGMMIGRFIGAGVLKKYKTGNVLALYSGCAAFLVMLSLVTTGSLSMWLIIIPGLFHSIMWPAIFGLATEGLGKHAKMGSGILCTAVICCGLWTFIQGGIADSFSITDATGKLIPTFKSFAMVFSTTFIFYAYMIFFALKGSKLR